MHRKNGSGVRSRDFTFKNGATVDLMLSVLVTHKHNNKDEKKLLKVMDMFIA